MIASGTRLGSYEVLESIGTGGMGEVFRARDARLGRDVAIKILSDRFRLDSQRLARFEREARVLASLNHANIATLHAVERLGDSQALILELVEGETLSERIARGPIPLAEVLAVTRQIAAALEAAHEQGVIHRDLKPSNIKIRGDGTVKLLDFGLAKVCEPLFPGANPREVTVTMEIAAGGAVMGTPAYMSPEHVRGLPVDRRTDIWAFGCVLYEMLTGAAPFKGERASDVVAKIIEREPDLDALPRDVPPSVRRLLQRCLRKDPRERLRDIGDARLDLEETGAAQAANDTSAWRRMGSTGHAAIMALVLVGIGAAIYFASYESARPSAEPAPLRVSRFSLPAPVTANAYARAVAIAPNGARFAYVSERGLFVRSRDRFESTEIYARGTSGLGAPFFSPDGKWIAYTDGQSLMKVPSDGGTAVEIVDSGPAAIGSWDAGGIVFASMNGLFRVSSNGGPATRLEAGLAPNEQAMFPQFLPGNKAVLFTVIPTRTNTPMELANAPSARVDVLDLASGTRRTLLRGGGRAQYVPTGHLVYVSGNSLYATSFDLARLEVRGDPVSMIVGVRNSEFGVADDGTLIYPEGGGLPDGTLVWVDRQGREEPLAAPPRRYAYPRISPDGTRVALDVQGPPDRDIWIWDLRRKTLERFTVDPAGNPLAAWSRDGRSLAFGSDRFGLTNLFLQAADGSGEVQHLLKSERLQMPLTFAPDGRLLFSADVAGRGRDILALSMDGSGRVEPVLQSAANDLNSEVSPDGRWIVYDSDETGQFEVYVRPYPQTYSGGRWQISSEGGRQPMWSHDGREIYHRDFEGGLWATPVQTSPGFAPGAATRLFSNPSYKGRGKLMSARSYDLSADGKRFLMIKVQPQAAEPETPELIVVLNWFEELKRAVPVDGSRGH
jgi:serine/threonine-protein kinase